MELKSEEDMDNYEKMAVDEIIVSSNCGLVQLPEQESKEDMGKNEKVDDFLNNGRVSIVCIKPSKQDLIAIENLNIDIEDFIGINPSIQTEKHDLDISINGEDDEDDDSQNLVETDCPKKEAKNEVESSLPEVLYEGDKLESVDVKSNSSHAAEIFLDCLMEAFKDTKCYKNFCLEVMGLKFYVKFNCTPQITTENSPDEYESSLSDDDIIYDTPVKKTPFTSLNLTPRSFSPSALNASVTEFPKQKNVIASSGVSALEKVLVRKFCEEFNYIYTDSRCQTYSVLVFKNPFNLDSDFTFKYYLALASKAAIVSMDWVTESIKANTVLSPINFLWTKSNNLLPQSPKEFSSEPLFIGITLVMELLKSCYPGAEAIQHLLKLTGATLVNEISSVGNSPCPRFILYHDEQQLTSQLLSKCSQYSTVAVDLRWIYDCLQRNEQLPISEYQSSTFSMSPEIYRIYHIPPALFSEE